MTYSVQKNSKHMKNFLLFFFGLCLSINTISAQDLVFKPINPAFGGDTFNYNWLLSSAQSQDNTRNTATNSTTPKSTLDDFQQSLNRQILSQLARQVVNSQFGETGLQEGSYEVGSFQIDISPSSEGVVITVLDTAAGEQTQIIVPYF